MSDSKLISYITSDFQTKSDMKVGEIEWEKIMNKNFEKFKEAELEFKNKTGIVWKVFSNRGIVLYDVNYK